MVWGITRTPVDFGAGSLAPVLSGLLARYEFDQGSGTELTDTSGNENHGTLGAAGAAPTWSANGLVFDGGDRVTIPVAIGDVLSVQFFGSQTSISAYNVVLSSDDTGGLMWGINNNTGNYKPNPFFWVGGVGEGQRGINDTYQRPGGNGAAWVQDGVADQLFVNGWPCGNESAGAGGNETSATGRIGNLVIGANPGNGALTPWVGTITGMLLYDRVLTDAEVAQNDAYLKSVATTRGLAAYANAATGRLLWVEGDSISTNAVIATAWPTTAAALYAETWTTTNRAIGGTTIKSIRDSIRSRTIQQFAAGATKNVVVIFAGTNDFLADGSLPAATVFGYLDTIVDYALAAGFQVVVFPMLSRVGLDAKKTDYNALIYAASWGANVRVVPTANLGGMTVDGAHADTGLFSDGTHPTQAASDDFLATAAVVEIDAIG